MEIYIYIGIYCNNKDTWNLDILGVLGKSETKKQKTNKSDNKAKKSEKSDAISPLFRRFFAAFLSQLCVRHEAST